TFFFGWQPQIVADERVDIGSGQTDLVAILSTNIRAGQGIVTVFDVGASWVPPHQRAAVVRAQAQIR
ncbi:hypothetical protein LCGC14_1962170, partial [marine sediment metagenome]